VMKKFQIKHFQNQQILKISKC